MAYDANPPGTRDEHRGLGVAGQIASDKNAADIKLVVDVMVDASRVSARRARAHRLSAFHPNF
jgi:hypothetical protein